MNYEKYQNKISYPEKPKKPFIDSKIATPRMYREHAAALEFYEIEKEKYDEKRKAYDEEDYRLEQEFKKNALEEVGLTNHPKADKIYAYAWQEGHSSGFSEVFNTLLELSELFLD